MIQPAVNIARVEHVAVLVGRESPRAPALGDEDVQLAPPIRRVRRAPKVLPGAAATESAVDDAADDEGMDLVPADSAVEGAGAEAR